MKKIIYIIYYSLSGLILSCNQTNHASNLVVSNEMNTDTTEGSCPYLTKDINGNLVMSWIKKTSDSTRVVCYAISSDHGKTFGKETIIPQSANVFPHGENMPKIIFMPAGEVIAVWGAANPNPINSYAGIVYYSQSFDGGKTWNGAVKLVKDSSGIDQRYFDVALLPDGSAAITWLDNRKKGTGDGSSLFFASSHGTSGFENEKRIEGPCCPCCRTGIFMDHNHNIHIIYRAILNDSIRDMVHIFSTDMGKTFSPPHRISNDNWVINGCPHSGPAMTENNNGLQFSWFTAGGQAGIYYCHADMDGKNFSQRALVSGPSGRHPQMTSIGNRVIMVWNENIIKGQNVATRIGLEIRNPQGTNPEKQFITDDIGLATFPVIKTIDETTVLIAYTKSIGNKDFVKYKLIHIK